MLSAHDYDQIETAFEKCSEINSSTVDPKLKQTIQTVLTALDSGSLRVAEKKRSHLAG